MRWIRPHHTRWLAACLLGLLLSVWAAGLSWSMVLVFTVIFAVGAALIAPDAREGGGPGTSGGSAPDSPLE